MSAIYQKAGQSIQHGICVDVCGDLPTILAASNDCPADLSTLREVLAPNLGAHFRIKQCAPHVSCHLNNKAFLVLICEHQVVIVETHQFSHCVTKVNIWAGPKRM